MENQENKLKMQKFSLFVFHFSLNFLTFALEKTKNQQNQ